MFLEFIFTTMTSLSFNKDIKQIFQKHCIDCHNENWPDKNWMIYENAFRDRESIKYRVWLLRSMPLGGNISEQDRKKIKDWVDQGAKL